MKLAAARIADFLRRPDPAVRAVLLFGPDAGLVRERADLLAKTVCPDLRDPFRVADLTAAALAGDPARLADEAAQLGLLGGRRVVRVRDAGDALTPLFAAFLDNAPGDALVVVEAGDLPGRSGLRRTFEAATAGAAIGCYPDTARDRAQLIREALAAHQVTVSRDAETYLVDHLGADRLVTRSELDKLALYAGPGGRIELDDARRSVGDSAAIELEDAVLAAAAGDAPAVERALGRVFQEGESPVAAVRALLRHLQRLHLLVARAGGGEPVDQLLRNARPPIFFKHQDSFRRQLSLWREPGLRVALDAVAAAEAQMKQTGLPAETICREAMLAVARRAGEARTGGSA